MTGMRNYYGWMFSSVHKVGLAGKASAFAWMSIVSLTVCAADVDVLVTLSAGEVTRATPTGIQPVQGFARLKSGDLLAIGQGGRLRLIYFANGRQETWSGAGQLEIGETASKPKGLSELRSDQLPVSVVKQIGKTPVVDAQGRIATNRQRSLPTPDALAKIDKTYRDLRTASARDDLNPEMYLLSALFEARALERVDQALGELRTKYPGDPQAKLLVSLYQRAVRNARDTAVPTQ
jgi:hypothetical protein